MASPHLVLVGMMGAGKTTTGRVLAQRLGRPLRDSDEDVEALLGVTGAELAAAGRVDDLHALEEAVLLGALAVPEPLVVAAAGWVVESPLCREVLARRAWVVHLDLPLAEIRRRIPTGDHRRAVGDDRLAALDARRRPMLSAVRDLRVDATRPTAALVDEIAVALPGH